MKQAAWFSAMPWGLMALSGYMAGVASDILISSGHSVTLVRKVMQVTVRTYDWSSKNDDLTRNFK